MAKRPKLNRGEKLVRMPVPPKAQEAALVRFCEFIVRQVFKRWRNNVFSLTKSEIAKFADSETAAKMLTLTDDNWAVEAQRRPRSRSYLLSDERIKKRSLKSCKRLTCTTRSRFTGLFPGPGIDTRI